MLHCSILWGRDEKKILLHVHRFPCRTTASICHSSLCSTYRTQPPPSTRCPPLLSLLLPVTGTPLPGLSDPLDLSMCIFPSLPLSTPSCACSPCFYYCCSPTPPLTFARKRTGQRVTCAVLSPSPLFSSVHTRWPSQGTCLCICLCSDHRQVEEDMTNINLQVLK